MRVPARVPYLSGRRPLPIAHRGGATSGRDEVLENSREAFRAAVEMGYGCLETDVHVSADGVVFALHDDTLDRVTDRIGAIAALSSDEVRQARIAGRAAVPLLRDLLAEFPDALFNIDVKSDAAVEPTLAVIAEAAAWDRVCLASFSTRRLKRIRRLEPRVATSAGPMEVALLRLSPLRWLRAVGARRGAVCVQVPHRRHGVTVVTGDFVRYAHELGLHVHVWTINDPAEMRHLLDLGVDGIVTDRVDALRSLLEERRQWA